MLTVLTMRTVLTAHYFDHLVEAGQLGATVLGARKLLEELGRVVVREEGLVSVVGHSEQSEQSEQSEPRM